MSDHCGDCRLWMTPRCPRERHSNVTGRSTGPNSLAQPCDKFVHNNMAARVTLHRIMHPCPRSEPTGEQS